MAKKLSRSGELFFMFAMFLFAVPISDLFLTLFNISNLAAAFCSIIYNIDPIYGFLSQGIDD